MPFQETCRMEQRIGMLADYDAGHWSVSDLCRRYEVSRDTFYAWRARRAGGEADSHATRSCPHRTDEAIEDEVVALRRRFPHLGPRKLLAVLATRDPRTDWPAASTIGDILKRAGLVEPAKRRRRPLDPPRRVIAAQAANEEWAADFKGWFRTKDQRSDRSLDDHRRVQPVFAAVPRGGGGRYRAYAGGDGRRVSRVWAAGTNPQR